jgi:cytochrome c peroxidase
MLLNNIILKLIVRFTSVALLAIIFMACSDEEVKPESGGGTYLLRFPSYFPQPEPLLSNNDPLTKDGVALGKMLFFDPILSGNNQVSCSTCHQPAKGFADGLALTSNGISGNTLHRHSPALVNLAWAKGFFWEGGSKNLESQALAPIINADEMGQNVVELIEELNAHSEYPALFKKTFTDGEINGSNIMKALAQFERTLISATTKYDYYRQGKASLTELESKGMMLVEKKCGSCHPAPLFTNNGYHNNGLDSEYSSDHEGIAQGRYRITFLPEDLGKFKVPTLRNIGASAPYMHDGRFATLDDVLDHYAHGIQASSTLDSILPPDGMALTTEERQAILSFLDALTDEKFMTDNKNNE